MAYNKHADASQQAGRMYMYVYVYLYLHVYDSEIYTVVFYYIRFQTKGLGSWSVAFLIMNSSLEVCREILPMT